MSIFFNQSLKKSYNVYSYFFLPTKVFFESNGTYINTEGLIKKSTKLVSSTKQPKENWQIIRKFFSYSKHITFIANSKFNTRISFNCNNIKTFKSFICFQNYALKNITNITFCSGIKNIDVVQKYLYKSNKIFETKFRYWLEDFYIKGKDLSTKLSATNIKLSKNLFLYSTNFI